jgi:hypothetical protein
MRRIRAIPVVLILVLAVLLVAALASRRVSSNRVVVLRLVTITNVTGSGRIAVFAITNPSPREISFHPAHPQRKERGLWPSEIRLRPPPSTPSEYRACTVAMHREAQFSVDLPMGVGIYRVPVLWGGTPTRMDLVRALCHENWTALQQGRTLPGFSIGAGQIRTNFTSEIEL